MNKNSFVIIVSIVVSLAGASVVAGWVLGIKLMTSILPNAPTMKFTTAVCFICSGVILYLIAISKQGRYYLAQTFLPLPCLVIILMMSAIVISVIIGVKTGIENMFVAEDINAILTVYPGRPSIGTIVNFVLIVTAGLITMMAPKGVGRYYQVIGSIVLLIGGVALLGYAINAPALYYAFQNVSTAMAIHTAMLFVLLGIALMILSKKDEGAQ